MPDEPDEPPAADRGKKAVRDQVRDAAREAREGDARDAEPGPLEELTPAVKANYLQDTRMRRNFAIWAAGVVTAQLVASNIIFVFYASKGRDWDVPTTAISAWLSATLVEVVGIVLVVARYLFPRRDLSN